MGAERNLYLYAYHKEHIKRVPVNMQKEEYLRLKTAADASGKTVSGYIKEAIREKMEREREP